MMLRAYSHGCMRVQDPAKYAEVLFNIARPSENWTADKIKRMFGTGEQDIQLPVPIWVHLTYQSAFVDEAGKLQTRRDVYNIDSRTIAAIKSERGMIEPLQERKRDQEVASSGQRRAAAPPPAAHHLVLRVAVRRRARSGQAGAAARRRALMKQRCRSQASGIDLRSARILCAVVNSGKFSP